MSTSVGEGHKTPSPSRERAGERVKNNGLPPLPNPLPRGERAYATPSTKPSATTPCVTLGFGFLRSPTSRIHTVVAPVERVLLRREAKTSSKVNDLREHLVPKVGTELMFERG